MEQKKYTPLSALQKQNDKETIIERSRTRGTIAPTARVNTHSEELKQRPKPYAHSIISAYSTKLLLRKPVAYPNIEISLEVSYNAIAVQARRIIVDDVSTWYSRINPSTPDQILLSNSLRNANMLCNTLLHLDVGLSRTLQIVKGHEFP